MLFNSLVFLYAFLPVTYLVFWRLKRKTDRYAWLTFTGYVFYAFWDWRFTFLLLLNVFLLAVGWLMEIYAAIVVVVPLIVPLGAAFGIHPVHLGIIFIANLELGFLTPLVGLNIFLASYRFKRPVLEVCAAALPMMAILGIGVLIITYVPWLTTGILAMLGR